MAVRVSAPGHRVLVTQLYPKSSQTSIETDFVRVRIGIGRPPAGVDPVAFVLAPFAAEERDALQQALVRAADGIETLLWDGVEAAMRACNPPAAES